MLSFFHRFFPQSLSNFTDLGVDMHSHLLPGIDDGSDSVAESEQLIEGLNEIGFTHLFTTPHTISQIHPNTPLSISTAFESLENVNPSVKLYWSSEYFLDELFFDLLNNNEIKPLPGNRLLIEFSMLTKPINLEMQLMAVAQKGYQIVLAHPERYLFFHKSDFYKNLKEMGLEFQLNALSLVGNYGKRIQSVAEELVAKEMIDFLGTDLHNLQGLKTLRKVPATRSFQKLLHSDRLKNRTLLA